MECLSCKALMSNSANFCNECGYKFESDITCSQCSTKNSSNSKFCMQCGNGLLTKGLKEKGEKVVLGNTFFKKLHKIFYDKILQRIELAHKASNDEDAGIHELVYIMDANLIKNEYTSSVKKCFDHLIYSTKSTLSKKEVEYVREKEKLFISTISSDLFRLLSDFNDISKSIIQNISNSTTEELLKGLKRGVVGATAASIIPGIGTILGGLIGIASGLVIQDKARKEEEQILERWENQCELIIEQIDELWVNLTEKIEEVAENTPIYLDIDNNLFGENTNTCYIAANSNEEPACS